MPRSDEISINRARQDAFQLRPRPLAGGVLILALIGSAAGGREVAALLADESERAALFAGFPSREGIGRLTAIYNAGLMAYFTALGATFAARLAHTTYLFRAPK